ncbi:vWA domain-containing protein [Roseovarius sp. C03]|uniref:vWA domain-containing protein n=1 Tax=Roseovarius sp. C03 TaxID=3449222 RepID=UPI003EDC3095
MSLDVTLLRPLWLLALPVLAGLAWWLWSRRQGLGDWQRVADPGMIRAMAALGRVEAQAGRSGLWAGMAVLVIAVLALAGPAVERRDTPSFRNLDGVLFVVDASSSVTEDVRWPQMQALGRFGLARLGTRPGGIVVYGGDAYLATGMTLDHVQLGQTFSLIGPELVPDPGTRPARALALAVARLEEAKIIAGDVVLFTDGAGLGPESLRLAARMDEMGARLSVVGMGGDPSFATHARAGGGRVFGLNDAEALADWLGQDMSARLERQDYPLIFWSDMGRYLLLLAAVPMLLMFRRQVA